MIQSNESASSFYFTITDSAVETLTIVTAIFWDFETTSLIRIK